MRSSPTDNSRARLVVAGKILFAKLGYENTPTSSVAREARTSESQLMRHFGGKAGLLEAITLAVSQADALVLDVREAWEYAEGHVAGATLIPLGQVATRAGEVPADTSGEMLTGVAEQVEFLGVGVDLDAAEAGVGERVRADFPLRQHDVELNDNHYTILAFSSAMRRARSLASGLAVAST